MSKSIIYQTGWVLCLGCQSLVFLDGKSWGGVCINNNIDGHFPDPSFKYRVAFEGEGIEGQTGWRHCHKCSVLFFAENETKGVCPKDHGTHDDSQSGAYELIHTNFSVLKGNFYWRWCNKCQQLFKPQPNNVTFCSRGGRHSTTDSGFYVVLTE